MTPNVGALVERTIQARVKGEANHRSLRMTATVSREVSDAQQKVSSIVLAASEVNTQFLHLDPANAAGRWS